MQLFRREALYRGAFPVQRHRLEFYSVQEEDFTKINFTECCIRPIRDLAIAGGVSPSTKTQKIAQALSDHLAAFQEKFVEEGTLDSGHSKMSVRDGQVENNLVWSFVGIISVCSKMEQLAQTRVQRKALTLLRENLFTLLKEYTGLLPEYSRLVETSQVPNPAQPSRGASRGSNPAL